MVEQKKYAYIDALRGWAILAVIFIHNYNYFDFGKLPLYISMPAEKAQYGVQLFFIVSALTLSLSFDLKSRNESKPLLNYFIRRIFRIAPLFYLAILLYTQVFDMNYSVKFLVSNFIFIFNLHPVGNISAIPYGWTIGAEMLFYIIFPVLFIQSRSLNRTVLIAVIAIIIGILSSNLITNNFLLFNIEAHIAKSYAYNLILTQLPVFVLGILLFRIIYKENNEKIAVWLILLISILLIINSILDNLIPEFLLFSIFFTGIIYALSFKPYSFFVNAVTIEIGKVSFSMYLLHNITLFIIKMAGVSHIFEDLVFNCFFRYLMALIVCYGLSKISYELIEKNSIKMGKRLIEYLERK